jgi:translation initiation factor 2B subunit (eIF-2B alpha/beta/delta family)
MSIDTKQIIHIASEIAVIGGITVYFMNKTNKLSDKIEELQELIQQQQEIIQQHDNLILKLMNNVNTLNNQNLSKFNKSSNINLNKLPKNITSSKQVVIMIPPEDNKRESSSINNYENLDDELEEELKDLDENINLEKEDNEVEEINDIEENEIIDDVIVD